MFPSIDACKFLKESPGIRRFTAQAPSYPPMLSLIHRSLRTRPMVALLTLCSLLLAGCLPESKYPLSTPANSVIDPRLEGVYAQPEKKGRGIAGYWHFHYRERRAGSGEPARVTPWLEVLTVEHSDNGGLNTHRYEALATRLGGHDYLSFLDLPDQPGKNKRLTYSFARYEVNWRGDLRVWIANNDAFAAAIKASRLRGKVTHGGFSIDSVEIDDTTGHLAAFIAAGDPKVLFSGEPLVMRHLAH